jgi:1-acyl-sn-glycerol-3-phosphate acyltransferase
MLGAVKLFAKASIRWIPGFGWGMWVLDFPFLYRNWADDVTMINKTFHKLQTRKLPFWLISHLEGTFIGNTLSKFIRN